VGRGGGSKGGERGGGGEGKEMSVSRSASPMLIGRNIKENGKRKKKKKKKGGDGEGRTKIHQDGERGKWG